MELKGVGALVTGGARRLGRALVLELAESGCRVAIHYGSSEEAAEETAAELRGRGTPVSLHRGDLADPRVPARLIEEASDALGPLQVLINSAATFDEDQLASVTREQWEETLAVNLSAPVFLTRAFAARLPDDLQGSVVNLSDWRTERPYPDHFSYTVAKAALSGFTKVAAAALAPRIRVNAVALGAILPPASKGSGHLRELAQHIPLRKTGSPSAMTSAVRLLLENDFITGQVLGVTGGAELV